MKKIIKISVTILILIGVFLKIKSLVNVKDVTNYNIPNKNVAIGLNYHRIRKDTLFNKTIEFITQDKEFTEFSVYEKDFEKQMDYLIEHNYYFATPEDLEKFRKSGKFPKNCVWISFDDVDKSVYELAYPILKERKIPFTVFIISSKVGNKDFNNFEMATWDDLKEMKKSNLVTFGAHTHNMHYLEDNKVVFLSKNQYKNFKKDIKTSKKVIEEKLNVKVDDFAYPFGETSDNVVKIVKDSGYKSACILSPNPITKKNNPYYLNRYVVTEDNFYKLVK